MSALGDCPRRGIEHIVPILSRTHYSRCLSLLRNFLCSDPVRTSPIGQAFLCISEVDVGSDIDVRSIVLLRLRAPVLMVRAYSKIRELKGALQPCFSFSDLERILVLCRQVTFTISTMYLVSTMYSHKQLLEKIRRGLIRAQMSRSLRSAGFSAEQSLNPKTHTDALVCRDGNDVFHRLQALRPIPSLTSPI